jgi:hypothetical protein
MPPAAPSRRTVTLSQSLNRDLSVYALAAGAAGIGAVAMPQPAQAQIVYTPAHEVLEAGSSASIDFKSGWSRRGSVDDSIFQFKEDPQALTCIP